MTIATEGIDTKIREIFSKKEELTLMNEKVGVNLNNINTANLHDYMDDVDLETIFCKSYELIGLVPKDQLLMFLQGYKNYLDHEDGSIAPKIKVETKSHNFFTDQNTKCTFIDIQNTYLD